jgi:sugar phosphate isomerase/epimerase
MTIRDREELERRLRELGVSCAVEGHDALAVAIPEPGDRSLENAETRRRAIELARSCGFSHLAVELREPERSDPDRASLSGD